MRGIVALALFAIPMVLMAILAWIGASAALPLAALATLSAGIGVGVERWLFFAEATHVSMLYYGRAA